MSRNKYKIIPEKNLIVEYYTGIVAFDDIIELKKRSCIEKHYSSNFNIIDDFRDATFNVTKEDIIKYENFVKTNKVFYGKRNTVFITQTPDQVMKTTLFGSRIKEIPINMNVTSTVAAALDWLMFSPDECKEIEDIIENLRIQPEN